jgi:hypothetical protein
MMPTNLKPTDVCAVLTTVDPVAQVAGANTTVWVPVQNFHTFLAALATGVLGASATVDFKLQQATDNAGTGAKDISGKAITQIVKATGDNKQALINCRAEDLDTNNGFGWIGMVLTVGTATSIVSAVLYGFAPRFAPPVDAAAPIAINLGAATVVQIV